MIFSTTHPAEYWDGSLPNGKPAREGVYIWVVHYDWPGLDGFIYPKSESGTVTVVR